MRKYLLFISSIFIVFILSLSINISQVLAEGPLVQARQELQRVSQENRAEALHQVADNVEARFTQNEHSLQDLNTKISDQLNKMKQNGIDTTDAEQHLAAAQDYLNKGTTAATDSVAKLRAITPENWLLQKPEVQIAKDEVKEAHTDFTNSLREYRLSIKSLREANNANTSDSKKPGFFSQLLHKIF